MDIPINYLAVLGAGISAVVIGALWYGPLFQKPWMRMAGLTKDGMKSMTLSPLMAMIGGLVIALLMAYVLSYTVTFVQAYTGTNGLLAGAEVGFWTWLGFLVPATSGVYLWEGKSFKLWILNAGYYLVSLLAMGAILGAFPA